MVVPSGRHSPWRGRVLPEAVGAVVAGLLSAVNWKTYAHFEVYRLCEGFRMPALQGGLPWGRDGAGVRKPSRKETASRKGAYPPCALWGFERRKRLLASGRNDHQRRFRRIERSDGVFSAGHGMIFFSAAVLGRAGRRIFGRAGAARSSARR
jgi:hypothetical protein